MKKLSELFCPNILTSEQASIEISDISDDSRKVSSGSMFIAIPGNNCNGERYIPDAIANGAKVILLQGEKNHNLIEKYEDVVFLFVPDIRGSMADVADNFFESSFDNITTVTGTNGKSSTVDIFRQIMNNLGVPTASIGTLGVISKHYKEKFEKHLTSPGSIELHKILHDLTGKVRDVVMEASSHGIKQRRISGIKFSVCGFTNFSEDHLDYHKTMDDYWKAKLLLFSSLAPQTAKFVVNADCEKSKDIEKIASSRKIQSLSYGRNGQDFRLLNIEPCGTNQLVTFENSGRLCCYDLPLVGEFQVYNSLCAIGMCCCCGAPMGDIVEVMSQIQAIPGRLELVATSNGNNIFVDYAHTPMALQSAILSLKKSGPVAVVFGCGGDRDKQKRKIMGQIAQKYADTVIVTDDNPRNENPAEIRNDVMEGCPKAIEIADRSEAIHYAIDKIQPGYSLLVAGKGHEDYQIIGNQTTHFSDKEVILEYMK